MNSLQTIKIDEGNISVTVHGLIVRATLKTAKEEGIDIPLYEVAMEFSGLTAAQTASIGKLILLLGNE